MNKKNYKLSIGIELVIACLFLVHINFKSLGSDFMFSALLMTLASSVFIFWQSFKNPAIHGVLKTIGLLSASLPIIWLVLFAMYFLN
jgi:hypothetical protein